MIFLVSKSSFCFYVRMASALSTPFRFQSSHCRLSLQALQVRAHPPRPTPIWLWNLRWILSPNSMSQPVGGSNTSDSQKDGTTAEDVVVQYVVLRRDLIDTWPLGSVVTQGCHASVAAIWSHKDDPHTLQYCNPQNMDSMHKVTLEVKGEAQMVNLSEKLKTGGIAHKLWIEQPENIPTCIATKPYPKSQISIFFKKLKLCK